MKKAPTILMMAVVILVAPAVQACSMPLVTLDALKIATVAKYFASTFARSPGVRIKKVRLEPSGLVIVEIPIGGSCQASAYSVSLKPDCSMRAMPAAAVVKCE